MGVQVLSRIAAEVLEESEHGAALHLSGGAADLTGTLLEIAGHTAGLSGHHASVHAGSHAAGSGDPLSLDALASSAAAGLVATSQSTSSTSYTDLATTGPDVTLTPGPSGLVLVGIFAAISNQALFNAFMGFALSSGNTQSAADNLSLQIGASAAVNVRYGALFLLSGLAAASTLFRAKYRVDGGTTSTFADRRLVVVPL